MHFNPTCSRAGDEVTISYGPWPNDVFYLLFGFVPRNNPFDVAVLFWNLQEMVAFHDAAKMVRLDPL